MVVRQFDVFLVNLDPTVGAEIQKTRPCLVVSPAEMNDNIRTVIIAPLTTRGRPYVARVPCRFQGRNGQVALDHIRSVDKQRLVKRLGAMSASTGLKVLETLLEMFEPVR